MVPVTSLGLPILLSAVLVFVVSSVIHMLTPWHKSDIHGVANEADAMAALRPLKIPPGEYAMPWAGSMQAMGTPEFKARLAAGPVVHMTVMPSGEMSMTGSLVQWFLYLDCREHLRRLSGWRCAAAGSAVLEVFRFTGTTAFAGYSLALMQNSIWWKRSWGMTVRSMIDGLIYACMTAGAFGWLWPR